MIKKRRKQDHKSYCSTATKKT